jgi:Zn-dependent protease with chaperone function
MHSALFLAGAILLLLLGALGLGLLRRLDARPRRGAVQGLILAAPLAGLVAAFGAVVHFAGRACFLGAPRWDRGLAAALVLGATLPALGGPGLGLLRLALLGRVAGRRGRPAGRGLETRVVRLALRLGVAPPRLLICALDRPLALACGLRRPVVLLSTWMLVHLDRRELEAVLAHEVAHVARRDFLAAWLTTILRDAFCYLPASRVAYRQLQREREFACDGLVVAATGRPLALASALVKVWQPALGGPRAPVAPSLVGGGEAIEERVARLLVDPGPRVGGQGGRPLAVALGYAAAFGGLLAVAALVLAGGLALLGCGPASALGGVL